MGNKRKTWKERYDFKCVKCGYKQWAKPSMNMTEFGINSGCGSCLECGTFLHLEITPDIYGERMVSKIWGDFLKEKGLKPSQFISKEKVR